LREHGTSRGKQSQSGKESFHSLLTTGKRSSVSTVYATFVDFSEVLPPSA
jgi:hypothetical protein